MLAAVACVTVPKPRPAPVLADVETIEMKVSFRGGKHDPERMYVCGTLEDGRFSCIDWTTFSRELEKDGQR